MLNSPLNWKMPRRWPETLTLESASHDMAQLFMRHREVSGWFQQIAEMHAESRVAAGPLKARRR